MESVQKQVCPNCRTLDLNVYFSEHSDDKIGVWCEHCNLKAYYSGEISVSIS